MMDVKEPSINDLEHFLLSNGKRASNTISLLGKLNSFVQAVNSPIGKELLKDDIERHEELLVKLYEENITDQEKAEFRYLKLRIKRVSERLATYVRNVNEVKKAS